MFNLSHLKHWLQHAHGVLNNRLLLSCVARRVAFWCCHHCVHTLRVLRACRWCTCDECDVSYDWVGVYVLKTMHSQFVHSGTLSVMWASLSVVRFSRACLNCIAMWRKQVLCWVFSVNVFKPQKKPQKIVQDIVTLRYFSDSCLCFSA